MSTPALGVDRKIYRVLAHAKPRAIIIACPDPRIWEATLCFIHEELGLRYGEYLFPAQLGGVVALSQPVTMPYASQHYGDTLEFCFKHFPSLEEIIHINHDDCARYRDFHETIGKFFLRGAPDLSERQRRDLGLASGLAPVVAKRPLETRQFLMQYANADRTEAYFDPA